MNEILLFVKRDVYTWFLQMYFRQIDKNLNELNTVLVTHGIKEAIEFFSGRVLISHTKNTIPELTKTLQL